MFLIEIWSGITLPLEFSLLCLWLRENIHGLSSLCGGKYEQVAQFSLSTLGLVANSDFWMLTATLRQLESEASFERNWIMFGLFCRNVKRQQLCTVAKTLTNHKALVFVSPCDFCLQAMLWLQLGAQNNPIHKCQLFHSGLDQYEVSVNWGGEKLRYIFCRP